MLNRAAILLIYKAPAVRWVNEADPFENAPKFSIENINSERTVYLIKDKDADDAKALEKWLKKNYAALFENELDGWYTDPELWPKERTYKLFQSWFSVECHTVIMDTVGGVLIDDET